MAPRRPCSSSSSRSTRSRARPATARGAALPSSRRRRCSTRSSPTSGPVPPVSLPPRRPATTRGGSACAGLPPWRAYRPPAVRRRRAQFCAPRERGSPGRQPTASSGSLTGSAVTQVTEAPRTIALTPSTVQSLVIGRTLQTSAAVCGASGRDVPGQPVLWTSSNGRVATIASSGVVRALAPGTMTITAAIGSLRASISVIVTSQQACAVFVRPCPAADVT